MSPRLAMFVLLCSVCVIVIELPFVLTYTILLLFLVF